MSHTLITHIGVSALSCEALRSVQSQNYDRIAENLALGSERPAALEIAQRDLLRGLGRNWGRSMQPRQQRMVSPAEIAAVSLLLTERRPDDAPPLPITRLVLLSSDTRGGEFCARLLEQAFVDPENAIPQKSGYPHMAHEQLYIAPIRGLSITDEHTLDPASTRQNFVRNGLRNYVRAVYEEYRALGPNDTLTLNITSGFKGLVPTARDLALLLGSRAHGPQVEMVYLYQSSSELVRYAPLPMSFVWDDLPITLLREAGTDIDTVAVLPKRSDAYLFEYQASQRLQRSPIGEVIWTLYTLLYPGVVDVPHADLS